MYRKAQLQADVEGALRLAVGFALIAALPLGLFGLLSLFGSDSHVSLPVWLSIVGVVYGGYFLAAVIGGCVYFLLRPLRRTWIGWALTGAALANVVYGILVLLMLRFYEPVGRVLLTRDGGAITSADLQRSGPFVVGLMAVIGAILGVWHSLSERVAA